MTVINMSAIVRKVSAFNSYEDLINSMDTHGYVPTLRRDPDCRTLGRHLEATGRRVFWSRYKPMGPTCQRTAF